MDLYSLKMDEGTNLHDHINNFNRLVSQLLNTEEKLEDEEKSLLLLSSLPKSYKSLVQTLLVGKSTLILDDVITVLRENQKLMGEENNTYGMQALTVESSDRGRNQRRDNNGRGRSRSRPRDYSNVECYYCGEKGHIQYQCSALREDLKSFKNYQVKQRGKEKYEDDSSIAEEEVVLMIKSSCNNYNEDKWVLDSAASKHVCKNKECFESFDGYGDFGHVNGVHKEKLKIEGVGKVRFKFHDGSTKILENVCYVPNCSENIISLGELCSRGYTYVGQGDSCKVFKNDKLIFQGRMNDKLICSLDGYAVRRMKTKMSDKKVKFNDEIEVFGDSSRGRNC